MAGWPVACVPRADGAMIGRMQDSMPSRTAIATSLMRASHTRCDPHRIFTDDWGDRLVPSHVRERIAQAVRADSRPPPPPGASVDELIHLWARHNPAYANVITRSRYAEDRLHEAVARGVRQYVLVGAGFDSYSLRRPAEGQDLRIFEVDHRATQSFKLERIAACGAAVSDAVTFTTADLSSESLADALGRSGFEFGRATLFSWLGVTVYLTREANFAALAGMARCSAPGSELVFTYADQRVFESDPRAGGQFARMQKEVTAIGEPFLSGFAPQTLARDLASVGFELLEDRGDDELLARYDPRGVNGLRAGGYGRIAHARAMGSGVKT
ncbi:MAG TPA: SAM-dependent methyltransferase [Ramlibacter sp.]|uniref:class I SAM-dependent methyltransferase n=1 Tax=Ramlibacter sp. TaxID=1917967 RepID=UPI002C83789C|nr:SAM-dependent methyltransferase [Ramlibacter sp.]HVZ44052.1 SAM-dependent methyltransferase [Ramlibacter sp.]